MNALSISSHHIRQIDNLFCLNDLHKAAGNEPKHQPSRFLRGENIQELVQEINYPDMGSSENKQEAIKTVPGRKGGTYVCKELVYAYGMWISARFHLLVIRAFDSLQKTTAAPIAMSQLPITPAQLYNLKNAARNLAQRNNLPVLQIYEDVMQAFGVNDLREITGDYYPQACAMLQTDAIEGEWLRGQMPPLPKASNYHYPKNTAKPYSSQRPNQSWLTAEVLLDPENPHPLADLLNQLDKDGHDVTGAKLEHQATRERLNDLYFCLRDTARTIQSTLERGRNVVW